MSQCVLVIERCFVLSGVVESREYKLMVDGDLQHLHLFHVGSRGRVGLPGFTGETGFSGPAGYTGPPGITGAVGLPGIGGVRGIIMLILLSLLKLPACI